MTKSHSDIGEVILGNSNKRFSGVTSTMLQTLYYQRQMMNVRVLGKHHLEGKLAELSMSFIDAVRLLRTPLANGNYRVFHARRNDEMIQALVLRTFFRAKINIIFTSTAQRYHSKFTRWLMSQMDCVLSTCQAAANYLSTPPYKIIPHGIETQRYYPEPENNSTATNTSITVGMFGRIRKQKGSHLFVRACISVFPKYPGAVAQLVGSITPANTPLVEQLRHEINLAGLADRIVFLGERSFEELPNLFRKCNIIAALSHTEGFGLTVLEAMSSGAAVLASKAGAWPEIIEDGLHGFLVDINNPQAIAAKLDKLLSNIDQTKEMGKAGREHVLAEYTVEQEAQALCSVYRTVMKSNR